MHIRSSNIGITNNIRHIEKTKISADQNFTGISNTIGTKNSDYPKDKILPSNDKQAVTLGLTCSGLVLACTAALKVCNKISNLTLLGLPLTVGSLLYYQQRVEPKVTNDLTDYYNKANEKNQLQRGARGTKLLTYTKEIASTIAQDINKLCSPNKYKA